MILSGPAFEPGRHGGHKKIIGSDPIGSHYSVWYLDVGQDGRTSDPEAGMQSLREIFPDGKASSENFVLFSTSGVHGCYTTIEEIEASLLKHGDTWDPDMANGDETYVLPSLTVLVVQPRIVCLRCGNVRVRTADIPYLKELRASSLAAVATIGVD